jgi:hypothetical protein
MIAQKHLTVHLLEGDQKTFCQTEPGFVFPDILNTMFLREDEAVLMDPVIGIREELEKSLLLSMTLTTMTTTTASYPKKIHSENHILSNRTLNMEPVAAAVKVASNYYLISIYY